MTEKTGNSLPHVVAPGVVMRHRVQHSWTVLVMEVHAGATICFTHDHVYPGRDRYRRYYVTTLLESFERIA